MPDPFEPVDPVAPRAPRPCRTEATLRILLPPVCPRTWPPRWPVFRSSAGSFFTFSRSAIRSFAFTRCSRSSSARHGCYFGLALADFLRHPRGHSGHRRDLRLSAVARLGGGECCLPHRAHHRDRESLQRRALGYPVGRADGAPADRNELRSEGSLGERRASFTTTWFRISS